MKTSYPTPRSSHPPHLLNGFTLVELLTVIAIVGVLAAIIITAIGSVKKKARQSQSLSNIKMLGQGFLLYSNDHLGFLPKHNASTGTSGYITPFWSQQISPYIGAVSKGLVAFNSTKYELSMTMVDPLLDEDQHHPYGDYGCNTAVIVRGPSPTPYNTIINPSRTVSVMTSQETRSGGKVVGTWYVESAAYVKRPTTFSNFQPAGRDGGPVLAAFLDGSTRAIPQTEFHENRREFLLNE